MLRPLANPRPTGGDLTDAQAVLDEVASTSPESDSYRDEILAFTRLHADALDRCDGHGVLADEPREGRVREG